MANDGSGHKDRGYEGLVGSNAYNRGEGINTNGEFSGLNAIKDGVSTVAGWGSSIFNSISKTADKHPKEAFWVTGFLGTMLFGNVLSLALSNSPLGQKFGGVLPWLIGGLLAFGAANFMANKGADERAAKMYGGGDAVASNPGNGGSTGPLQLTQNFQNQASGIQPPQQASPETSAPAVTMKPPAIMPTPTNG